MVLERAYKNLPWIGAALLLSATAALAMWATARVNDTAAWEVHTFQVINKAEALFSDLKDAESGQRGFLLTGDERFLAPYFSVVNTLDDQLAELHQLTATQPEQQQRLDRMQPLIVAKLAILKESIARRRSGELESALTNIRSGRGRELMDEIRREMDSFQLFENALLRQRGARFDASIRWLTSGVAVSAVLAVLLAGGAAFRTHQLGQAARRRAAFQGTLLDSADMGILSTDPDGLITSFNRGAETLLGYRADELIGKQTPVLFHDADELARRAAELSLELGTSVAPGFEAFIALPRQGQRDRREWTYLRKDGNRLPVMLTLSAMRDDRGMLTGYLGIARDILAQKSAEARIARTLKELADFKSALDQHAIVATTDADGTITYANDKFCTISRYSREELVGQNHRIINSGHHPADYFRQMWQTIGSGAIWQGEIMNRAKDGAYYWVQPTIVPFLDERGVPFQYIAIGTDITARKHAEQALYSAKTAAELANRTKDSFLATMSHEIRTPLGGLLGMLELLSYTSLNGDQRETLRAAHDSGRSLLRIVNDILDWSKIEAGKLELAPQPTSLPQLVAGVANTYARVASTKSLILEQHADPRLSPAHIVDPLRLSQVLNNFVSNALKFTRKGRVEVRADLLECHGNQEKVRFSVSDTGIGIPQDVQQRLFQSFSQGDADTARMYGGTGLGLSICRRLAEMMHGQIGLASEPGRGSTFSITLSLPVSNQPAHHTHEIRPEEADVPADPLLTQRETPANAPLVLVVDDHPTNRKLMATQLGLLGLRSETADNGERALAMWQNGHYDVVITDCHMPKMDGFELAQAMRRIEAEQAIPRTPILAWTANALSEETLRCHASGMDEVLVKPASLSQLNEALSNWTTLTTRFSDDGGGARAVGIAAGAIDLYELDKLCTSATDKAEVLQDFMTQSRADLAQLEAALDRQDWPASVRIAHRMKGASRMVGAHELAAACMAAETEARNGRSADVEALKTTLDRLVAHVATALPFEKQCR